MTQKEVKRCGFTMVELLMVVVIVVVLFFVFMPASQQARDHSKRAGCTSNLRQIGVALNLYTDENDGRYPTAVSKISEEPKGVSIAVPLHKYIKEGGEVFLCPAERDEQYYRREGTSYEWNAKVYNRWKPVRPAAGSKTAPAPVMSDFDNFHGPADKKESRNYLYPFAEVNSGPRS